MIRAISQREWKYSYLTCLCVDPTTVWMHWNIIESWKTLVSRHFGQPWHALALCLRIHDCTDIHLDGTNAHNVTVLSVTSSDDHAYCRSLNPGRVYIVDLAIDLMTGAFFTILRSSSVATPRTLPVHSAFTRFMPVGSSSLSSVDPSSAGDPPFVIPYKDTFDGYSVIGDKEGKNL